MNTAIIFDIQRNSFVDGPGIRTTVFFKGCNLKCKWCHNPESQSSKPQIMFYKDKCTGCGRCKDLTEKDAEFVCFNDAKKICAIDIKDEKGNVVETVGMKVYTPIESMKFEYNSDKTIYVGDQMGEDIEVAPAGALSLFDWSVDKNDVIEVYGSSNLRRGIIAKAPGEVTLTVKDKNGDNAVTKKITVLPDSERPKDEIGTTVLTKTGSKNKISDSFFGFHMVPECLIPQNQSLTVERMKELNTSVFRPEQALMQSVKNKENSNKYENWHQVFEQDYPIWEIAKQSGNRMSYVVDPISYDDESCIEQVKYLYEKIGGGYTLELGNEVYAIGAEERFSRAKDYFEWAKDFAVKVKSISPDITCVAVIFSNEAEMRILADPYNNQMLEADWAYTQAHRVDEWNKTAEEYKDDFDGFISHNYASVESIAGYTGEEFLRKLYAYVTDDYYSILANSGRLGNKPMYITEWGNLAAEMFWGAGITNEDKIRFQWQMYPAAAIKNMEQLLNYANKGDVFAYSTDGKGYISSILRLYDFENDKGLYTDYGFAAEDRIVVGKAYERYGSFFSVATDEITADG